MVDKTPDRSTLPIIVTWLIKLQTDLLQSAINFDLLNDMITLMTSSSLESAM